MQVDTFASIRMWRMESFAALIAGFVESRWGEGIGCKDIWLVIGFVEGIGVLVGMGMVLLGFADEVGRGFFSLGII